MRAEDERERLRHEAEAARHPASEGLLEKRNEEALRASLHERLYADAAASRERLCDKQDAARQSEMDATTRWDGSMQERYAHVPLLGYGWEWVLSGNCNGIHMTVVGGGRGGLHQV